MAHVHFGEKMIELFESLLLQISEVPICKLTNIEFLYGTGTTISQPRLIGSVYSRQYRYRYGPESSVICWYSPKSCLNLATSFIFLSTCGCILTSTSGLRKASGGLPRPCVEAKPNIRLLLAAGTAWQRRSRAGFWK